MLLPDRDTLRSINALNGVRRTYSPMHLAFELEKCSKAFRTIDEVQRITIEANRLHLRNDTDMSCVHLDARDEVILHRSWMVV